MIWIENIDWENLPRTEIQLDSVNEMRNPVILYRRNGNTIEDYCNPRLRTLICNNYDVGYVIKSETGNWIRVKLIA